MTALECVGKGDVPKKPVSSCTITSLIPSKDTDAVSKKKGEKKKKAVFRLTFKEAYVRAA